MSELGLYVHVPFCAVKCPYCDFYSMAYSKGAAEAYAAAVAADLRQTGKALASTSRYRGERPAADTLYFGGGTPGLLPPELLSTILSAAREAFRLEKNAEVTLEANPNTVSPRRLSQWREMGVNRISFGLQSAEEGELSALGRRHSAGEAAEAVRAAVQEGIANISLDLMLGTPGQTRQTLRKTLEFAAALPASHLSAYMLKVEEGTPYWNSPLLSRCMDEDALADAYLEMVEFLEGAGFMQYEISNFARQGRESLHNLKYWRCEEYLGFGPAAHSFFDGKRTAYLRDLDAYLSAADKRACEQLTDGNAGGQSERAMLGLRLTEGISLSLFDPLPEAARKGLEREMDRLSGAGYVCRGEGRLRLTAKGFLVSNEILAELLRFFPDSL